ncbi:[citrate (pro-3S)-lyase] ligase [Acerihabitans arboris]|uniref:[Citrate [pro-3S]-lyase] ligase n=1 Tax=Acerihabitans arboris TaxID=2691583 RepID=A0A845SEN9_9GAMM|nr:[citrate (pro-3S)-lyase] ligase [Acerihabitans arboris]NDL63443.1 [citrate (pro-3S)-lyase] ligase [Acerihabitans arboris]
MYDRDPLDFSVLTVDHPRDNLDGVRALLEASLLGMDADITRFVVARGDGRLAGCAGIAGNVIKCVAVAADYRGDNLSARLVGEVEQLAVSEGHFHLFLYTRPSNIGVFRGCGFYPIAQWDQVAVLMENTPVGIRRYSRALERYYQPGNPIGAVVMNANPFTLGHRYLAEQAAAACDWLHIFVVREDVSLFPYAARLEMVRRGVAHLANVQVHEGSDYLISRATFPGYFLRDTNLVSKTYSAIDLLIFRNHIAPPLGITHRFVGTEPYCPVTNQYNRDMRHWLEDPDRAAQPPLRVVEIPRKCQASGRAISASEVRALLKQRQMARIQDIVPPSTFAYLTRREMPEPAGICATGA